MKISQDGFRPYDPILVPFYIIFWIVVLLFLFLDISRENENSFKTTPVNYRVTRIHYPRPTTVYQNNTNVKIVSPIISRNRLDPTDSTKERLRHISTWTKYFTVKLNQPTTAALVSNNEPIKDVKTSTSRRPRNRVPFGEFNFIHREWLNEDHTVTLRSDLDSSTKTITVKETSLNEHVQRLNASEYQPSTILKGLPVLPRGDVRDNILERITAINELLNKTNGLKENITNSPKLSKVVANNNDEDAENEGKYDELIYRKHVYNQFYREIRPQKSVDCHQIVKGDEQAIDFAKEFTMRERRRGIPVEKYFRISNCNNYKRKRGYIDHTLSELESNFPIAFALVVYRDVEQIERLLRAIYRPHNYYCVHVDTKARLEDQKAIHAIARCFDNVFISSMSINVTWGEYSVLEAELICMEDLLKKRKWKYYINLTGQEFPLRTNREIVNILQAMNGENVVEGAVVRAGQKYFNRWTKSGGPPPHGIRPVRGSVHVAVNREFVDFCLHDTRAKDYLDWLRKTDISDETFFASLNYNAHLGAPGAFKGPFKKIPKKSSFSRFKIWKMTNSSCTGKFVHNICILGVGDVYRAYRSIGLFVNKLHLDFEYLALDCLEEILYERTWQQYLDDTQLKVTIHKTADQIKYIMTF